MKPSYWIGAGFGLSVLFVGAISSVALLANRSTDVLATRAILSVVTASRDTQATRSDVSDLVVRIDDMRTKMDAFLGHAIIRRYSSLDTIAALQGRPFILFVGDSITAWAPLPGRICNIPVVNAAIGGTRVSDFIPIVEDIVTAKPNIAATVIALGLNDAQARLWTPHKAKLFSENYSHLVRMLPKESLILSTITQVDLQQTIGKRYDISSWTAIDNEIRAIAHRKELPLVDNSLRVATTDGVHLTESAYVTWIDRTTAAVKAKLGCQ